MSVKHRTPWGFTTVVLPGGRITYNPSTRVRLVHKKFLEQEGKLKYEDPATGVLGHLRKGHTFYFKTDLKSAFDCVTYSRLWELREGLGINFEYLEPVSLFFHNKGNGGLIQGAPSSSYLFEVYCRFGGMDFELQQYCEKLGFHYIRTADDLLFSSPRRLGGRVGPSIRRIVGKYGFLLNDAKSKRINTLEEPLRVLGYVVRGTRLDPDEKTMQKLFSSAYSDDSRWGIRHWRKRVRRLNRQLRN